MRKNDKEQKRVDLIKEKRNRERQIDNDIFLLRRLRDMFIAPCVSQFVRSISHLRVIPFLEPQRRSFAFARKRRREGDASFSISSFFSASFVAVFPLSLSLSSFVVMRYIIINNNVQHRAAHSLARPFSKIASSLACRRARMRVCNFAKLADADS